MEHSRERHFVRRANRSVGRNHAHWRNGYQSATLSDVFLREGTFSEPAMPILRDSTAARRAPAAGLLAALLIAAAPASAQEPKRPGRPQQPDFIPAGYDDYQHMLDQ